METIHKATSQFKTNIKCGGCIAAVTPSLNQLVGEGNWQVDTQNPDKLLTVQPGNATPEAVRAAIEQAGYKAEVLN